MASRSRRWFYLGSLAIVLVALVALVSLWQWSWFRGHAESFASDATGRQVRIHGDMSVALGLTTEISLRDVTVGNAEWGEAENFAKTDHLKIAIHLPSLIGGEVRIPTLRLEGPEVWLERNAEGGANWRFPKKDKDDAQAGAVPQFGEVSIGNGLLHYDDKAAGAHLELRLASAEARSAGEEGQLTATAEGTFKDAPLALELAAGPLSALAEGGEPYPVDLTARIGETRLALEGRIAVPPRAGLDLRVELEGENAGALFPIAGIRVPDTPPFSLNTRLVHETGAWELRDLAAALGKSRVQGSLRYTPGAGREDAARPKIAGDLTFASLDFGELRDIASAPDKAEPETPEAAAEAAGGPLIPDVPLPLGLLRSMDADISLRAPEIPGAPLDSLNVHVVLEDGNLTIEPIEAEIVEGHVTGALRLDAGERPPSTSLTLKADHLALSRLVPRGTDISGRAGARIELSGSGDSLGDLLNTANGQASLFIGGGRLNAFFAEIVGLDLAGAVRRLLTPKADTTPIRCVVADFEVKSGVMHARAILLDITETIMTGSGTISLQEQSFDLTLSPRSGDVSLFSLRAPITITGPFANPEFGVSEAKLGAMAGAALGLGLLVGPAAALVPMLETGLADDTSCGHLLNAVRNQSPG